MDCSIWNTNEDDYNDGYDDDEYGDSDANSRILSGGKEKVKRLKYPQKSGSVLQQQQQQRCSWNHFVLI